MFRRWTPEEIDKIKKEYQQKGPNKIALELNRSATAIQHWAYRHGIPRWSPRPAGLTHHEWYRTRNQEKIAAYDHKRYSQKHPNHICRNKEKRWRDWEIEEVKRNYANKGAKRLATELGCSVGSVAWLAKKLGLKQMFVMNVCHKCGALVPSMRRRTDSICNTCNIDQMRGWLKAHKDRRKAISHNYYMNHKEERAQWQKQYLDKMKKENPERFNLWLLNARIGMKRRSLILRRKVLSRLGSSCIKCGFSDWRAFQIDHIHGHGGRELRAFNDRIHFYKYLLALPLSVLREKYQLLCANCNWIKKYENGEGYAKELEPFLDNY